MPDDLVIINHDFYNEAVPASKVTLPRVEAKAMELPIITEWQVGQPLWPTYTWDRLKTEGFNVNAAFSACVTAYAFALPEPPLLVTDSKDEPVGKRHPLQQLLTRPNPYMSHNELMSLVATFLLVGGNAYLHKVRNGSGQVLEIYPYHDGHLRPIPGRDRLIEAYRYDIGDGRWIDVPWEDIIHLKWPVADLDFHGRGLAPLRLLAREVDADSEVTRMLWALLHNDATPRTMVTYPKEANPSREEKDAIKAAWAVNHGGERRGGMAIATGGATVQRISLALNELDLTTLRRVPETRITAVCQIPAMLVGLSAGLERSTYSNMEEARKGWTTGTLSRLWALIAGEIEADLAPEFGPELTVAFDTSKVAALQPNMTQLRADAVSLFEKRIVTQNEARRLIFMEPVGDIKPMDGGDIFSDGSIPSADKPEEPEPQELPPPMLVDSEFVGTDQRPPLAVDEEDEQEDAQKAIEIARKVLLHSPRDRVTLDMVRAMSAYLDRQKGEALREGV